MIRIGPSDSDRLGFKISAYVRFYFRVAEMRTGPPKKYKWA